MEINLKGNILLFIIFNLYYRVFGNQKSVTLKVDLQI
jgi:hypothetical protein